MKRQGFAFVAMLILSATSIAQPPGGRPPRPDDRDGRRPPPSGLIRAVDDLRLPESSRNSVVAAFRNYEDDAHRLAELAGARLLLKMKDIVGSEEFAKLRQAVEQSRGGPERLNAESIVEHIMSFDKNKDGKISKDELPERMQDLMEKGDANQDGFLDKDEIKKLATEMAKEQRDDDAQRGGGNRGQGGRGNNNNARGVRSVVVAKAVNDLKLSGSVKEAADAAIKANQAELKKMTEFARADLLLVMADVLTPEESRKLETAMDRMPPIGDRPPPGPGRNGPPPRP